MGAQRLSSQESALKLLPLLPSRFYAEEFSLSRQHRVPNEIFQLVEAFVFRRRVEGMEATYAFGHCLDDFIDHPPTCGETCQGTSDIDVANTVLCPCRCNVDATCSVGSLHEATTAGSISTDTYAACVVSGPVGGSGSERGSETLKGGGNSFRLQNASDVLQGDSGAPYIGEGNFGPFPMRDQQESGNRSASDKVLQFLPARCILGDDGPLMSKAGRRKINKALHRLTSLLCFPWEELDDDDRLELTRTVIYLTNAAFKWLFKLVESKEKRLPMQFCENCDQHKSIYQLLSAPSLSCEQMYQNLTHFQERLNNFLNPRSVYHGRAFCDCTGLTAVSMKIGVTPNFSKSCPFISFNTIVNAVVFYSVKPETRHAASTRVKELSVAAKRDKVVQRGLNSNQVITTYLREYNAARRILSFTSAALVTSAKKAIRLATDLIKGCNDIYPLAQRCRASVNESGGSIPGGGPMQVASGSSLIVEDMGTRGILLLDIKGALGESQRRERRKKLGALLDRCLEEVETWKKFIMEAQNRIEDEVMTLDSLTSSRQSRCARGQI